MTTLSRFLFFLFVTAVGFMSCAGDPEKQTEEKSTQPQQSEFSGEVIYSASVVSPDTLDRRNFFIFAPSQIEIYFSPDKFRMIEHGGASAGNILIDKNSREVWQIDTVKHIVHRGQYSDFNMANEDLRKSMPDMFSPAIERTGEKENIAGYECEKYIVIRSGMLPEGQTAVFWATSSLHFPSSRYDIQTPVNRATVPLPLLIGYNEGAILKMEIMTATMKVIYTVTTLTEQTEPSVFTLPQNYSLE